MPFIAEKAQVTYGEEAYGAYGTVATARARSLGLVQTADVPGPENDLIKLYTIGGGRDPIDVIVGAQKNDGLSINMMVQNMRFFAQAMGAVADTGTDSPAGGGSTLNGATIVGATSVILADSTGYVTNDYVQIDVGANAEVRKITNVVSQTLTLDEQLRKPHLTATACNEVIAPFTHTITGGNLMVDGKNQFSQSIEVGYAELGTTDFGLQFLGCMLDSCDLSIEAEKELTAGLTYNCAQVLKTVSLQTVSIATTSPYLYSVGELMWNSSPIARVGSCKLSVVNNGGTKRYIRSTGGRYGFEYIPGKRELKVSGEYIADDATIIDDFIAGTQRVLSLTFTRAASDTMTLTGTLQPGKLTMSVPASGEIPASFEGVLKTLTCTVVDSIDHY